MYPGSFDKSERINSSSTGRAGVDIGATFWIVLSFTVAVYMIFVHLGLLPLINPDEGRNASIAWEMRVSGHWLIPTYNGLPYLDKPSLFFKMVATSMSLFGHNEFAARLPSALSAIGILIMAFLFSCREYNLRTASLAVLIISTAPLFFAFSRTVIFDMPLTFFVCASIFAGYFAEKTGERAQRYWYIVCAVMAGIATLVKGPVGFVVPTLVLIIYNYLDRRKGANHRLLSWKNLLLLLLVVMPWFVGVSVLHPDFPYYGLVKETFMRFTTDTFHHSEPFYYYLPIIFGLFLFWSLLLPEIAVILWRHRKQVPSSDRFLLTWVVSVLCFFSLSKSKLPGYVLPAIIPLGILTAQIFDNAMKCETKEEKKAVWHGSLLLFLINVIFGMTLIIVHIHPSFIEGWLRHIHNPAVPKVFHSLTIPLIFLFLGTACLELLGIISHSVKVIFSTFLMLPLLVPSIMLPNIKPILLHRSDCVLSAEVSRISHGSDIVCFLCFPEGLPFYLKRQVTLFTSSCGCEIKSNYIPFYLSKTLKWPSHVMNAKYFKSWLDQRHTPFFLIVKNAQKMQVAAILEDHHRHMRNLGHNYWGELIVPQGK